MSKRRCHSIVIKGMKKMKPKFFYNFIVLISWGTLPFLGLKSIRRFLPATIFISFVIMLESYVAKERKWWVFRNKYSRYVTGETPYIVGPFLSGSLWILKLSYGKFFTYLLLNFCFGLFFVYPFTALTSKFNISRLKKMNPLQLLVLFLAKSFLMYGYQMFIEGNKASKAKT